MSGAVLCLSSACLSAVQPVQQGVKRIAQGPRRQQYLIDGETLSDSSDPLGLENQPQFGEIAVFIFIVFSSIRIGTVLFRLAVHMRETLWLIAVHLGHYLQFRSRVLKQHVRQQSYHMGGASWLGCFISDFY